MAVRDAIYSVDMNHGRLIFTDSEIRHSTSQLSQFDPAQWLQTLTAAMTRSTRPLDGVRHRPLILLDAPAPTGPSPLLSNSRARSLSSTHGSGSLSLAHPSLLQRLLLNPTPRRVYVHSPYTLGGQLELHEPPPVIPRPHSPTSSCDKQITPKDSSGDNPTPTTEAPRPPSSPPPLAPASSTATRCSHPRPWRTVQVRQKFVQYACPSCGLEWRLSYARRHVK
jgi:predicted RNA-binding Zn-ribbon protein involved in translation (DUF1610 family)